MQTSLLFVHQHNSIASLALALANYTCFQHFLHMSMDLIHHRWRYSLEPFLEGLIISNFHLMLHHISTAQLHRFQGKDVMVFSQLGYGCQLDSWGTTLPGQTSPATGRVFPFSAQLTS